MATIKCYAVATIDQCRNGSHFLIEFQLNSTMQYVRLLFQCIPPSISPSTHPNVFTSLSPRHQQIFNTFHINKWMDIVHVDIYMYSQLKPTMISQANEAQAAGKKRTAFFMWGCVCVRNVYYYELREIKHGIE